MAGRGRDAQTCSVRRDAQHETSWALWSLQCPDHRNNGKYAGCKRTHQKRQLAESWKRQHSTAARKRGACDAPALLRQFVWRLRLRVCATLVGARGPSLRCVAQMTASRGTLDLHISRLWRQYAHTALVSTATCGTVLQLAHTPAAARAARRCCCRSAQRSRSTAVVHTKVQALW